jgi:hypothetical protein
MLREALADTGFPKVVLFGTHVVFQAVNVPWFSRFVASIRTSRLNGFRSRNVRDIEPFKLN